MVIHVFKSKVENFVMKRKRRVHTTPTGSRLLVKQGIRGYPDTKSTLCCDQGVEAEGTILCANLSRFPPDGFVQPIDFTLFNSRTGGMRVQQISP